MDASQMVEKLKELENEIKQASKTRKKVQKLISEMVINRIEEELYPSALYSYLIGERLYKVDTNPAPISKDFAAKISDLFREISF